MVIRGIIKTITRIMGITDALYICLSAGAIRIGMENALFPCMLVVRMFTHGRTGHIFAQRKLKIRFPHLRIDIFSR
jgi:hypothetical protein